MNKTSFKISISLISALLSVSAWNLSIAQDVDGEEEDDTETLAEYVEDFERLDGLFPLFQDPEDGSVYLEVHSDQLDEEFIYFLYTENGPVQAQHFRGAYRDNRVISFQRYFDRIEIEAINTGYYFDPESALSRASNANISRAPLANLPILATSDDEKSFLISADAFLESEKLHQVTPFSPPDAAPGSVFKLGKLSGDKSRITDLANFPANTDIRVEYVYDNPNPMNFGGSGVTDARSVAILVQHSFLEMPEDGFEPRLDDFRVGYFTDQTTDLTSSSHTPYRDFINRWRLEKQDPDAEISDPVKPITLWIENTTPLELRDMIKDAALAWNPAFEAAGISNAIVVEVQPDDADWDAGDIRYNVMRWTSSPLPPFGGYGPSFTNPRTGEIIGADIMLEYVFLTNRMRYSELFETAGLSFTETETAMPHHHNGVSCNFASHLQSQMMTARAILTAQNASPAAMEALVEQELYYLILHEIGHTLGLTHNMRSSSTVSIEDLTSDTNHPVNSVMDYPAVNIAAPGQTQGQYAITVPGAYDVWAIQYGYTPEADQLDAILARSTEPKLAYGNDADDMRAPGRHIDPRVMISDLSDDPITWADQRIDLIEATLEQLPDRALTDGETYQKLYNSYMILTGQRANAAGVASRWIGGVYNNRATIGQAGAETPLVPVPAAEQRRALALIDRAVFSPNAFDAGEDLLNRLQTQRRGFSSFGFNTDPQPHARALAIQRNLLNHMLHPNVLTRMTDTRRYGGDYPVSDYLRELTATVYNADERSAVNTYRQNLQIEYLNRLIAIAMGGDMGASYDFISSSAALSSIDRIKAVAKRRTSDAETKAHRAHMLALIEAFERRE